MSSGNPCIELIPNNVEQFKILSTAGKSNLRVPIKVYDDDDITRPNGVSSRITGLSFLHSKNVFYRSYIDISIDGGGQNSNNQSLSFFERNTNGHGDELESISQRNPNRLVATAGYEREKLPIFRLPSLSFSPKMPGFDCKTCLVSRKMGNFSRS